MKKSYLTNMLYSIVLALIVASPFAQAKESESAVHILINTPFSEDHEIRNSIVNECTTLGSKLAKFTRSYADKRGIEVVLEEQINSASSGRYLQLEITDAVSRGNAFIGHNKFVAVKGTLWQDGKAMASFDGRRFSMGGFMGGYKGSCSVLGRCVKTLGKDIAAWLDSPTDGVSLGD
jgi:hypothetical protein